MEEDSVTFLTEPLEDRPLHSSRESEMKKLIKEFRGLYKEKLARLEQNSETDTTDVIKMKMRVMKSYVVDLSEQNEVLVQAIEDMEMEGNDRVNELESRMAGYIKDCDEATLRANDLEDEITLLKRENLKLQEKFDDYLYRSPSQQSNKDLSYDINNLAKFILDAKSTGDWKFDNIQLKTTSTQELFGDPSKLREPAVKLRDDGLKFQVGTLQRELEEKEGLIGELQAELKKLSSNFEHSRIAAMDSGLSMSGIGKQGQGQGDRASQNLFTDKDVKIMRLQSDLRLANQSREDALCELTARDSRLDQMKELVAALREELEEQNNEKFDLQEALEMMEGRLKSDVEDARNADEEMRQMQRESHILHERNTKCLDDISQYERLIHTLQQQLAEERESHQLNKKELQLLQLRMDETHGATKDYQTQLKREMINRQNIIQKTERENLNLKAHLENVCTELNTLQEVHGKLSEEHKLQMSELRSAKEAAFQADNKLAVMSREYEQNKTDLANCEDQIGHLESELEATRGQQQESMKQVEKLTVSLQQIQGSFKDTRDALSSEVSDRQTSLNRALEELHNLKLQHEKQLVKDADHTTELDRLRMEKSNLTNELATCKTQLTSTETQMNDYKAQAEEANLQNANVTEMLEMLKTSSEGKERDLTYELNEVKAKLEISTKEGTDMEIKFKSLQEKLKATDERLKAVTKERKDLHNEMSEKDGQSHKNEIELVKTKEEMKRLFDDIARRDKTIKQLENEKDIVSQNRKTMQEENGKLQARMQAYQITSQSEQEVLSSEIARKEEAINRYKLKYSSLEDQTQKCGNKVDSLEKTNKKLQQQHMSALREIEGKEASLKQMENRLLDAQQMHSTAIEELSHLKSVVEHMKQDTNRAQEKVQLGEQAIAVRDEQIEKLKEEICTLQNQQRELLKRLSSRDDMLHKVTIEATKLKEKYRLASSQSGQSGETIRMLEDELARTRVDLSETNRITDEETHKCRRKAADLESDLREQQQRYDTCYQQLLQQEAQLAKMKEEQEKQDDKLQSTAKELTQLRAYKHKTELNVAVLTEKHRTAQEEVSQRDQQLLKFNTELNTMQAKFKVTQEENEMHLTEVERLNAKAKQLNLDLKDCREKIEAQDIQLRQERTTNQQLKQQLDSTSQELRVHSKSCEHLQRELETLRNNARCEATTAQQETDRLRKELLTSHAEAKDSKYEVDATRKHVTRLQSELDKAIREQQDLLNELNKCEENLQTQLQEVASLKRHKDKAEEEMTSFKASLNETSSELNLTRQKYEESVGRLNETQNQLDMIEGQIELVKNEIHEKDEMLETLNQELEKSHNLCEERGQQISTCEDVIEELTRELQKTQDEMKITKHRMDTIKEENSIVSSRMLEKQQEIAKHQEVLHKFKSKLDEFEATHTHSNEDYNERQEHILRLERELAEMRGNISDKQHQVEGAQKLLHEMRTQIGEVGEDKRELENEVKSLEKELSNAQKRLDEAADRQLVAVEQEKAKVASMSRQLEYERHANEGFKEEINQRDSVMEKLREDLATCQENVTSRNDEVQQLEGTCNQLQIELDRAVRGRIDSDARKLEVCEQLEELGVALEETRGLYRECAQELAHYEEKVSLKDKNLTSTQQELGDRVTELARSEQLNKRLQAELKQLRERCSSSEEEGLDQARSISKLKCDVEDWRQQFKHQEEVTNRHQESVKSLNDELSDLKAQARASEHEVKRLQDTCQSLERDLDTERTRHSDARDQVVKLNKQSLDLNSTNEELERHRSQLQGELKDSRSQISRLEESLSHAQMQLRASREENNGCKERISEQERELESAQRQHKMKEKEIERYEENLARLQQDLDASQQQYKDCHKQLLDAVQKQNDYKLQLSSIEGNLQESMDQLGMSSKENANLRGELQKAWHDNQAMAQEIGVYEDKLHKLKNEFRKVEKLNKEAESEVLDYGQKLEDMAQVVNETTEKNRLSIAEIAKKEEQLVVLKVELASLQNKHKKLEDEHERSKRMLDTMQHKLASSQMQVESMHKDLTQARSDSGRLRTESEAVVENVNIWVREQKHNNERMSERMAEQAKELSSTIAQRDNLLADNHQLKEDVYKLRQNHDDLKDEAGRSKALQRHSSEQQNLILQLRNRLSESEKEQEATLQDKNASLDDLHRRLKQNVDCIQQLNQQLNNLSKENSRQRSLVEQEISTRKSLELQLEAKEQALMGLRAQLDARSFSSPARDRNFERSLPGNSSRDRANKAAMEYARNGLRNPDRLDKEYWVGRVGELSLHLHESSSYWSEKVKDLTTQLDDSRLENSLKS